tara:strand:+ start:9 stop:263 length:255 start_codon:yes stop_codon:yes gene_type:complete
MSKAGEPISIDDAECAGGCEEHYLYCKCEGRRMTNENCTDQKATVFDKHGDGVGGWIDCSQQRGSKSIESTYWCRACIEYYGDD